MIMMWFKKTWLIALVTALSFGSFPLVTALAQGVTDLPTGTPTPSTPTDHLANIWSREMDAYTKIGSFLTQSDVIIQKIQEKINKAKENGRDVTNVQAALDAFAKAIKEAEPLYENAGELIASHPGFDVNGKVLDPYQGVVTVKNLRDTLVEIRQLLIGPDKHCGMQSKVLERQTIPLLRLHHLKAADEPVYPEGQVQPYSWFETEKKRYCLTCFQVVY